MGVLLRDCVRVLRGKVQQLQEREGLRFGLRGSGA